LKARVSERCGELAERFDSLTSDAFAKGLVDRFIQAVPRYWQPQATYQPALRRPEVEEIRRWIAQTGAPAEGFLRNIHAMNNSNINMLHDRFAHGCELPYEDGRIDPTIAHLGRRWWREVLNAPPGQPSLSFPMLSRLAAYLLRENPKLLVALRSTYPFVFMDEFQDTTAAQYDLISTCFDGSSSLLTAVGDSKQRIMLWAGAMPDVFEKFQHDFSAGRRDLVMNHRAAPELVEILHVIATAVEEGTKPAIPARSQTGGECTLLEFPNHQVEAEEIADRIATNLADEEIEPRDICILVKQRTAEMIVPLQEALARRGIQLRDESVLQDTLTEPAVRLLLSILKLSTRERDSEAWVHLSEQIAYLHGIDRGDVNTHAEREASRLVALTREMLQAGHEFPSLVVKLVESVGRDTVVAGYRQYARGSYLEDVVAKLGDALQPASGAPHEPRDAVDYLLGADVIPAMTIHKSKGLEFHTVVFLGLEDSQWWSFRTQSEEDKRAFFVAFSRAMHRVVFTFCGVREGRRGVSTQYRVDIHDLYDILKSAGVPVEAVPGG
jgi:superfamily I DNA/RNA helicase